MTKKFYYIIVFLLTLQSCASSHRAIPIALDPYTPAPVVDGGFVQDQEALGAYVKKNSSDRDIVRDATLIFEARQANLVGDGSGAVKLWFRALEVSRGHFGELAFNGWLKAYTKSLGRLMKRVDLAKLVLAETKSGSVSPWMIDRSIQSEDRLSSILTREVSEFIQEVIAVDTVKIDAPITSGLSSHDPVLVRLAADVCRAKAQFGNGWDLWRASFKLDVNLYFDALVAQCTGKSAKALEIFSDIAPRLAARPQLMALALEAYTRIIKIRRDQGERESVAPLYLSFMELWQAPSLTEQSLGISRTEFEQRRIDDTLWAARARAVIGDGANARIFSAAVLGYLASVLAQSYTLTQDQKNNYAGQMAETYHLLSFRVAVDARDWSEAFQIAGVGLEQPNVPLEWKIRLRWSQGIYKYLAADYDLAKRIWAEVLTEIEDDRLKPQLLFWAAQAESKLGNITEATVFRKSLAVDFPLSYYSVVGLQQSDGDSTYDWSSLFKETKALKSSLQNWQKIDIEDLRTDPIRGPLVRRAEIFTSLGMVQFSGFAIDELQKSFDWTIGGEREAAWGLYVSRLYAASGNWLNAISTTTKLAKDPDFWKKKPEQMWIYFPRPYFASYKKIGIELGVDSSILLGISRQESSFKADIKSGANAWGLMQLTPPTARRLLPAARFPDQSAVKIPESLIVPDVNIRFGATFVKELIGRFLSNRGQIFAAYNAGPQAADNWIAKRLVDDPMLFVELIPYSETRDYVKAVWRNEGVYGFLEQKNSMPVH